MGRCCRFNPSIQPGRGGFSHALVSGATLPLLALALLLLPLQLSAGLRQQQATGSAQLSRIASAEQRLTQLRQRTTAATNAAELNAALQKLGGPVLRPSDLAQPLPLLKAQINAVLDQAPIQINRDRAALPPSSAVTALPLLLRNALSCLLLAVAYAAFARRPGSDLSLLQETLKRLQSLQPLRPRRAGSQGDDVRQLSGREE